MTGVTKHGNWYTIIKTYNDVTFLIKLLIVEKTFEEILDRGLEDNAENTDMDLF